MELILGLIVIFLLIFFMGKALRFVGKAVGFVFKLAGIVILAFALYWLYQTLFN